jgi:hypothetical protein
MRQYRNVGGICLRIEPQFRNDIGGIPGLQMRHQQDGRDPRITPLALPPPPKAVAQTTKVTHTWAFGNQFVVQFVPVR